jgi:hypothetical protein
MSIVHFSQWSMDNGQWLMVNWTAGGRWAVITDR